MEYVTLVNRSSRTLKGTWDGRQYELKPGKHSFPEIMAIKFKEQNPIMGSEDPYTLVKDYLIGIEELGDNCDPVEQTDAISLSADTIAKIKSGELRIIKGNGLYAPRGADASPSPFDSPSGLKTAFTKPD